jgi:hypothetical protein
MNNSSALPPYRERVSPGISYFLSTLVAPIIVFLITLPFGELLSYICAGLLEAVIITLGLVNAPNIQIAEDKLRVGVATIDLKFIKEAREISRDEAFVERGRNLNPRAYVRFQFGVKGLVRIDLNDRNDPTPYWLVSSRYPDLVAKRLNAN